MAPWRNGPVYYPYPLRKNESIVFSESITEMHRLLEAKRTIKE